MTKNHREKRPRLNNNNKGGGGGAPPTGKRLSHSLSWALRHAAPELGLTMTPDGYVPIQEILDCGHQKLKGVTLDAIESVVSSNDKQRFKIQEFPRKAYYDGDDPGIGDGTNDETSNIIMIMCIRANQGHSIQTIDPNLLLNKLSAEELKALPCIVHGTYNEPWKSIVDQGLKKMKRTHIHFASGLPKDNGVISGMRKSCTVSIFINAPKCAQDGIDFFTSDNGVILTAGINGVLPPKYISHVTDASGKVLLDQRSKDGTTLESDAEANTDA